MQDPQQPYDVYREHAMPATQPQPPKQHGSLPVELASILLVEENAELRESRRLVISSIEHPVLAVSSYHEVLTLPRDSNCCLVAIDLRPSEHEARRIAMHVRSTWPSAKILLLGQPTREFESPLYDDSLHVHGLP